MKYRFMAEQRGTHSVGKMARVLEVSRSGYHAWLGRAVSRRQGFETELTEEIREIQRGVLSVRGTDPGSSPEMTHLGHALNTYSFWPPCVKARERFMKLSTR
jgi:hypothetical protein